MVDDAVVVRRVVSKVLDADPELEVVAVAANGRIALSKLDHVNPDIVTLDIEMPELDGLATLKEIRKSHPRLPVIMFSTLTDRGAEATLDALALGANDYVTKPANVGKVSEAMQRIRDELIPKIKTFCGRHGDQSAPRTTARQRRHPVAIEKKKSVHRAPRNRRTVDRRIDIVAIGVSTGGPNALAEVLPNLPEDLPVPVLIVQHMPPVFTKFLADRLSAKSELDVKEGAEEGPVVPGTAWIAPGGFHMTVQRFEETPALSLNQDAPESPCRPAVDVLFRSVVDVYGPHVLGIILTGMGQDGLCGCERISDAGGQVIVQDEESSVVWGMPGYVASHNLADRILPLKEIAGEIVRRVNRNTVAAVGGV